ncbi:DUF3017 domain-containing protein [Nocardioides campestrisoli]|uniref:DUF3017 domain-containing protein n=1 Tax=Nocardioides campestrisoli TaxID=2736757 RepID=UPI0015E7CD2F|nr:DUF3017 domain-containing protein [Nocardioides campestrisoli]
MSSSDLTPPEDVPPVSAEALVDGEVREDAPEVPEERTYPSTIGGAFYLLFLVIAAVALVVVSVGPWRTGVRLFGGVLLVAAVVRVLLPSRDAGMLAVRNKGIDAGLMTAVGAALLALASSIPDQPV